MAVNTWKLWEKLGLKHKEIPADPDTDIKAILDYLDDVHYDVKELKKYFAQLEKLREEDKVLTDDSARKDNLRRQIELYDQLLLRFQYYDNDADINGIRVKKVAKYLEEQARKNGLHDALARIKKEARWFFDW